MLKIDRLAFVRIRCWKFLESGKNRVRPPYMVRINLRLLSTYIIYAGENTPPRSRAWLLPVKGEDPFLDSPQLNSSALALVN